jgi:hypothetical protein
MRVARHHTHTDKVPACKQVKKLKANLEDARRRMGAQSRSLQQHWRRGITMGDTVRLLSDINSIVDTPQRLQKLEEAKASLSPTCLLASGPSEPQHRFSDS